MLPSWVMTPWFGLFAFALSYGAIDVAQMRYTGSALGLVPFNIAVGFAAGVLVRAPRDLWLPILAIQAALGVGVGILSGQALSVEVVWALLAAIQSCLVAYLVGLLRCQRIVRWEQLLKFFGIAAAAALIGASAASLAAIGAGLPVGSTWRVWWVATAAGVTLVTPVVLAVRIPRFLPGRRNLVEFAVAGLLCVSLSALILGSEYASSLRAWGAQYLLIPLMLWLAVRFGVLVTAITFIAVDFAAIIVTSAGFGPFVIHGVGSSSFVTMQLVMMLIGLAIYSVGLNEENRRISDSRLTATRGLIDSLLANSDAMISVREYSDNAHGRYTVANPKFARSIGREVDQVVGRTEADIFPDNDAKRGVREDLTVLASRKSQVFITRSHVVRNSQPESRVQLVTKFPVVDAAGNTRSVGSIALDITEHRRREQLMRLTFDQSPVPMVRLAWIDGVAGEVLDVNPAAANLLGPPVPDLVGRTLDRFTHPEERGTALVPADSPGQARRREVRLVHSDGHEIWVAITATVVESGPEGGISEATDEPFALVVLEDITARKVAETTLTHQALHDALTGVLNRYALVDRLESALNRLWRDSSYVAVLFCDLDGFKNLNDTLGHRAGDQVLVAVSERLRTIMRPQDTVARLGGDEFVLICEDLPSPALARVIGERIREAMRVPFTVDGRDYGITTSVGIATTIDPKTRTEDLLRRADLAMYRAKDNGRNRVEFYVEELEVRVVERVEATETLRRALRQDRIVVHYQPIFDLVSSRVVGVEALARLRGEDGALVHPSSFIAVAESSGLVSPMGERVLDIALDQLQEWAGDGLQVQLNVNVSPRQLAKSTFAPAVFERLVTRGLAPKSLCLEITEGAAVDATGPTLITLRRLRSYGVHVGIDDFGTGYSSLTTLKYLPADVLKIDRSFVEGLGTDPSDTAIVGAVVRVAHELDRLVVAEGVETAEQEALLRQMGCDQVQGFRYGKPMSAEALRELLVNAPLTMPSPRSLDLTDLNRVE